MITRQSGTSSLDQLIQATNAKRTGPRSWQACCPAHEDRSPSLTISIGADGKLLLHCFAGCSFKEIIDAITTRTGGRPAHIARVEIMPPKRSDQEIRRRRRAIECTWAEALPITAGCPVDIYLHRRGIRLKQYPEVLRYAPALDYYNEDGKLTGTYPAMLARFDSPGGELATVHKTHLTTDGTKAPVPKPKKLMACPVDGCTNGGAIRLFPAGELMGVSEGIETALAIHQLTGGAVPVWATWSAGGMKKLILPATVRECWIFADNDSHKKGTGEKAARTLADRLVSEGRRVKVLMPTQAGKDFADIVRTF